MKSRESSLHLLYKHCSGPPCVTVNQVTPHLVQLLHVNSTLRFAIKQSTNLICVQLSQPAPSPVHHLDLKLLVSPPQPTAFLHSSKCAPPKATTAHVQNHQQNMHNTYSTSQAVACLFSCACGEPHLACFQ